MSTDPSTQSALGEAIDLATTQRSRLTLLTAVSRPPYWANSPLTAAGIEPLTIDLQKEAERCSGSDRARRGERRGRRQRGDGAGLHTAA